MKIFLLVLFSFNFALEFFGAFSAWLKSKDKKEYGWRLADTVFSVGMIFAFIMLVEVLSK